MDCYWGFYKPPFYLEERCIHPHGHPTGAQVSHTPKEPTQHNVHLLHVQKTIICILVNNTATRGNDLHS